MQDTQEMIKLAKEVKANTERLLTKHYDDNVDILRNAAAWKNSALKDKIARGALYQLCSQQGDVDMDSGERAKIIAESVALWAQIFGSVLSPKTKIKHLPLILFPFQIELIEQLVLNIERGSDFLIEKSREMGVSWMTVYVFTWYWLFKPGSNFLLGSYKFDLVSDHTPDSMIGKIEYILDGLPKWMMPKGYNKRIHLTQRKIINPHLDNYITGDTMNQDFGRGARKTAIFFDELGMWDYGKAAWESSGETSDCRIGNSTPNGYNYFKKLIDSGLAKITLFWRQHPLKDDLWYKYKKMKDTPETIAREIDISYDSSRVGVIYNEWKNKSIKGHYPYNPQLPLYVGWDFGNADGTAIIWCQVDDGRVRVIDAYFKKKKNLIDFFAALVTGNIATEYQYDYTDEEFDMIQRHSRWKKAIHFGDPSGHQKHQNQDMSVIQTLNTFGIKVNTNYQKISHQARQSDAQKIILRGLEIHDGEDTFTEHMEWLELSMLNYSFTSTNIEGELSIKANAKPRHDQYSHMATAFEYLAVGLMGIKTITTSRVADKFSGSATGLGRSGSNRYNRMIY